MALPPTAKLAEALVQRARLRHRRVLDERVLSRVRRTARGPTAAGVDVASAVGCDGGYQPCVSLREGVYEARDVPNVDR